VRVYQEAAIEAAELLFARQGIDATKMEDIAAEAGMSLRTLYSVLEGGKSDLVESIRLLRLGELVQIAVGAAGSGASPTDRLRALWLGATEFFLAHPDYLKMHLAEGFAWGLPGIVSARSGTDADSLRDGMAAITSIIADGQRSGCFVDERPDLLARAIVALHQVYLADWVDGAADDATELFDRFWRAVSRLVRT
jgi:AcrR family transcriptional regulator